MADFTVSVVESPALEVVVELAAGTGPQGEQGPPGVDGVDGVDGADGATGPAGPGLPTGGTSGQVAIKQSATNYDTAWGAVVPSDSSVTNAKVDAAAAIAESKLNLASDASAGTASRRTLGTGATQAAAGNHAHAASAISFTPDGSIAATTVQAAVVEVRDEAAGASLSGYSPYAYPIGFTHAVAYTAAQALPANGGAIAVPMLVSAPLSLEQVAFFNTDAATARGPAEFAIFQDANSSGTLSMVTGATGTLTSWTPGSAAVRVIAVSSPPISLAPGVYWLVIKNNHASNTMGVGLNTTNTLTRNQLQTKTLTASAFSSTLDLVTGWTKSSAGMAARLEGRILGQSSAY